MTSSTPAAPVSGGPPQAGQGQQANQAGQVTAAMREPVAFVLVGAAALLLLAAVIDFLLLIGEENFALRAGGAYFDFLGIAPIVLPLLAVLLATHLGQPVRSAKLITQFALAEYAVAAFFGVITFFSWLIGGAGHPGFFRGLVGGLLTRLGYLLVFLAAASLLVKVWRALYHVPKPKPQPGVYGQPPQYGPGGYPPGYPQYGGYPGQQPGYPAGYGQPGQQPGQPYGYGQPVGQVYGYGQPAGGQPTAGQPASGQPGQQPATYGQPQTPSAPATASGDLPTAPVPTSATPGGVEPTQVIPPAGGAEQSERTQLINRDGPGEPGRP